MPSCHPSKSLYIRKRGGGESAVREAFADAILIARQSCLGRMMRFSPPSSSSSTGSQSIQCSATARFVCSQNGWLMTGGISAPSWGTA